MDAFTISGGRPLLGEFLVSGAKNAALPMLALGLLADSPMTFWRVPALRDIDTMLQLLQSMGAQVTSSEGCVTVDASTLSHLVADATLVSAMRASIVVLGPLLARFGNARVALPGGCAIGARPVNLHLQALEALGASIHLEGGYIHATGRLRGADIRFDTVTVTGTENILMAAVLAEGSTVIRNAACEPEVCDLAFCLQKMGAKIKGIGSDTLMVEGVSHLSGVEYTIMPDRIEAGTYLTGAMMTSGCVKAQGIDPMLLLSVLTVFEAAGASVRTGDDWVQVDMRGRRPTAVRIDTAPYPAFPTDMQAQVMAMNTIACGEGVIVENIFENRFMHAKELIKLGADITLNGRQAITQGMNYLIGTHLKASDLRASASLVLAGLVALGETTVHDILHIDRGYEGIEKKLRALGAKIARVRIEETQTKQVALV